MRELTDIMATHEYGTFLMESKDLSVLRAGINRSRDRRLKGIQKQGLKAISQLVGASKTARSGARVLNHEGNSVELVLNQPMHCIVLLTELMHEGDWSEVVSALLEASLETKEFFHILDFRELISVLMFSNGDARLVDYNLMKRFECLVQSKSVHIRSRIGAAINPNEKINNILK